ncbi:MAG: hypothetical protein ABJC26_01745 [Gemmatimonadaceae bacterium]
MITNANASLGKQVGDATLHPAPLRNLVSKRAMWFGILGAPAAWTVQFLVSYALSARRCFPRLYPFAEPERGATELRAILLTLFVVALVVAVFALITAVGSWRASAGETGGNAHNALDIGEGRTRFMALGGILISSIFVLAMFAQGALVLSVQPCTQQSVTTR